MTHKKSVKVNRGLWYQVYKPAEDIISYPKITASTTTAGKRKVKPLKITSIKRKKMATTNKASKTGNRKIK